MISSFNYARDCTNAAFQIILCIPHKSPDDFIDSIAITEAAKRLQALYAIKLPKIREYIANSQNPNNQTQTKVYSRVFLEYIYAKKISSITKQDTNKLMLQIHPDKRHYSQAKELFQMHQSFLEMAKLAEQTIYHHPSAWFHYKLFG